MKRWIVLPLWIVWTSCGSSDPATEAPLFSDPGAGPATSGGAAFGGSGSGGAGPSSASTSCVETACGPELSACPVGSACRGLVECAAACADQSCVDACIARFPAGLEPAHALVSCYERGCPAAGPSAAPSAPASPPGPAPTTAPSEPGADGSACLTNACGAELTRCSAECRALLECATPCADESCVSACMERHPSGIEPARALGACHERACTGG